MTVREQLLDKYQARKTRSQKDAFIGYMKSLYPDMKTETGGIMKSRNLVFGDIEKAKVIYTAHYDTCARTPFPNLVTPKYPLFRIVYAVAMVLPLIAVMLAIKFALMKLGAAESVATAIALAAYFALFAWMLFLGAPNKHTANDNTSGILAVLDIMERTSGKDAAFVLFDNEEYGCVGSGVFYKAHKDIMADKLLFNLDCVGDGDEFLLIATGAAREKWGERIEKAFPAKGSLSAEMADAKKVRYSSDQKHFPVSVAAAAFNRHPRFGLYLGRIHTSRDVICRPENIEYITECAAKLAE